jgi:tRNA(fMet)-specific endonuclease VapC
MFLLDTNICIYAIRQRSAAVLAHLRARRPTDMGVSAITVAELQYGVAKSARPEANAEALQLFLASLEIFPFDDAAATEYGRIRTHLEASGTPIGAMDLLIAAHAKSLHAVVVTNNEAEFRRVPGIDVENWAQ